MSNKKLTILGIVAVVMVAIAILQSNKPQTQTISTESTYLVQGLSPEQIDAIEIKSKEGSTTLVRIGKRFVVADKDNYPANADEINELINQSFDIKADELVTSDAKNHADLGVTEDTARYVVRFLGKDAAEITSIITSEPSQEVKGLYVRTADSDNVYLSLAMPWFMTRPMQYIKQDLTSTAKDDIVSVMVDTTEDSYTLKTDEAGQIALEGLPAGKQLKQTDAASVFTALSTLQFEDVQKESDETAGMDFNSTYVCKLKDSTVYTFKIAKKDDKVFVKCSAEFTDTEAVTKSRDVESEDALKEKEAKLLSKESALLFDAIHDGWVYTIATYKADSMTKPAAELMEDIKTEEEKAAE